MRRWIAVFVEHVVLGPRWSPLLLLRVAALARAARRHVPLARHRTAHRHGALIGLAALPVVFTLLRTRKPEFGTPRLALALRVVSIALLVLASVLIIGTAISELWLSLDRRRPVAVRHLRCRRRGRVARCARLPSGVHR